MKALTHIIAACILALFASMHAGASVLANVGENSLSTSKEKNLKAAPSNRDDDLDEYSNVAAIADPIQPVNRGVFWVNHQIYRYILKPISKTYDFVLPGAVRTGIYNVFENIEFPQRFVNDLLQGRTKSAGYESGKFMVNSVGGVAGIFKVSDKIPCLTNLPHPDTGQTFAKWGVGHGCFLELPFFGPKSVRDTVGLAGDLALNPVTWVSFWFPSAAWIPAITTPDSLHTLHEKLSAYDAVTQDTVDRYLAVRSAYIQNRNQAVSK
jgi:phospholipid-binding lipoprotein MlaA